MCALLDWDRELADRSVILQAIAMTWRPEARPDAARRVAEFYLQREAVADRPGAYGI